MKNGFNLKLTGALLVLYALTALPALGSDRLEVNMLDQSNAVHVPRFGEPSHFDATTEYIGVISDEKRHFQLFDLQGNVVISERMDTGMFFMVQMRDYDGFFILGWSEGNSGPMYAVYDYSGRKLLDTWCRVILKAFPSGEYYFTENDNAHMEIGTGPPTIYDSQGKVLAEFSGRGDLWEMTAVNDSLLVLEHYNRVQLIAVPSMTVLSDISVDGVRPTGLSMRRSLSPDGTHYAYLTDKSIVICDLHNESAVLVPLDYRGDIPTTPVIFLSPNADYLLTHDNPRRTQTIDVFKKEGGTYIKTVDDFTIPMDGGGIPPVKGTFVADHVFAATFARYGSNGLQPRTYLYRFDTPEAVADGQALEGFVWIDPQSPERINRLTIDGDAGTASVSEVRIRGM